jgi:hypothetical protein
MISTVAMKRRLIAVFVFVVVGSALGQSPAKIRITTWNLEWLPNESPHDTADRSYFPLSPISSVDIKCVPLAFRSLAFRREQASYSTSAKDFG